MFYQNRKIHEQFEAYNNETSIRYHYGRTPYCQNVDRSAARKNSNIEVVLKTDDSRTAIDHLRTYPVDLVILDIELHGADGFTLLKRIKSLQEKTRVLFLSSKSESFTPDALSGQVQMVLSVNART